MSIEELACVHRADVLARTESHVKDPWIAACLVSLGEPVIRLDSRRDAPGRTVWVFANPNGTITELIHQIYQHADVSLVPAMVLRQSYKAVLEMAREFELGVDPSGAAHP